MRWRRRLPALAATSAVAATKESPPNRRRSGAESLVASASVGYVARALPGFRFEHPLNGPVAVLGHLLSTGYLWEKVRMEGGAYGAFSYPRNMDGPFPPRARTVTPTFPPRCGPSREGLKTDGVRPAGQVEVDKAVIGTIGREDRPIDPGEKGFVSMQRKLHGITDEARQARRTSLLAVEREGIAAAARELIRVRIAGLHGRSLQTAARCRRRLSPGARAWRQGHRSSGIRNGDRE